MPDDPNTTQNPTPEENSIPASPQEPMADEPIPPIDSEPAEVPSGATEASGDGFSVKSDNIPPSNSTPTEAENEQKTEEKQAPNELSPEPVSEPAEVPEPRTAQIPVNEPLENETETSNEQAKPVREQSKSNLARELLITARNAIQFRKRKKLDRVMSLFLKQSKITNDEVEKFLHVSGATATRYLSILEKEGKIKQNGKTGHMVSYSRI
ncbi:MAG: Cell surface glycoprotein 1 [Parcubacteria group bacterium GW2011_GWA2_47_12]|nr:MAG: Cell surface glycoprotein 1 [Parcubacteria group bacterium GW2011_GWA2_47_12]